MTVTEFLGTTLAITAVIFPKELKLNFSVTHPYLCFYMYKSNILHIYWCGVF